jgi:hypothetical protein
MGASKLVANVRGGGTKTPQGQAAEGRHHPRSVRERGQRQGRGVGLVDYLQIAKVDGRWVIANVPWELKPKKP